MDERSVLRRQRASQRGFNRMLGAALRGASFTERDDGIGVLVTPGRARAPRGPSPPGRWLARARDAGATTTTLEATAMGRPVYERMGYRTLGELQMWERRTA